MKLLILGTSHAGVLRQAQNSNPDITSGISELAYYVTPGGTGPYFDLDAEGMFVTKPGPTAEQVPYFLPKDAPLRSASHFDAIAFCAVDGSALTIRPTKVDPHSGTLFRFNPKREITRRFPLMSDALVRECVRETVRAYDGFALLRALASKTKARIFLQPAPLPSEAVRDNPEWTFRRLYEDAEGAYRFYVKLNDEVLGSIAKETGATLLPLFHRDFTPLDLMQDDLVHGNARYGALALSQIVQAVTASH